MTIENISKDEQTMLLSFVLNETIDLEEETKIIKARAKFQLQYQRKAERLNKLRTLADKISNSK